VKSSIGPQPLLPPSGDPPPVTLKHTTYGAVPPCTEAVTLVRLLGATTGASKAKAALNALSTALQRRTAFLLLPPTGAMPQKCIRKQGKQLLRYGAV